MIFPDLIQVWGWGREEKATFSDNSKIKFNHYLLESTGMVTV